MSFLFLILACMRVNEHLSDNEIPYGYDDDGYYLPDVRSDDICL